MHIACEQHALAHITAIAARIAPRRPSHPALAGVKLTAQDGELTATSYDGGRAVSYTVTATVFEPGEALVSAWLLGEIAKQAAARPVTLTRSGHRVYVECDASRYTLPTLPLEDYPTLPELPPEAGLASASNLADAISRVAPAAATPTSKAPPALQGVVLEADATHLTLVATDAYQLATARVPWRSAGVPLPAPIVVQANHLAEVARALGQGTVRLHANDATLGLTTDALRVTTRLMDARPPRWRRVLPSPGEAATIVRTHRATLAAAVRRITPVLDGGPARRACAPRTPALSAGVDRLPAAVSAAGSERAAIAARLIGRYRGLKSGARCAPDWVGANAPTFGLPLGRPKPPSAALQGEGPANAGP